MAAGRWALGAASRNAARDARVLLDMTRPAPAMDLRTAKIRLAVQIEWAHGELEAHDSADDLADTLRVLLGTLEALRKDMDGA